MPVRSLNYTGRRRILMEETSISLHEEAGGWMIFNADIRLGKHTRFPENAAVYVEAYRGSSATWMRFPFGTVKASEAPQDRRLTEFDTHEGILFRVRVTSVEGPHGLLLGEGDRIRPKAPNEEEPARKSLLPVRSDPNLGQQVYRLDFADGPVLLVNSTLGDWREIVRDRVFMALVLPSALEAILMQILLVEKYRYDGDADEEDTDWRNQWLDFASKILGATNPPDDEDPEVANNWIEEVTQAFCRLHKMLERYEEYWNRGDI